MSTATRRVSCRNTKFLAAAALPAAGAGGQPEGEAVVCSKTCWNKVQAQLKKVIDAIKKAESGDQQRVEWAKGGKSGKEDPKSSVSALLEWVVAGESYAKCRGSKSRIRKIEICGVLARRMSEQGARVARAAKQAAGKATLAEQQFRKAHDFANTETGAGLHKTDTGSFKEATLKKCKWCDELEPTAKGRAPAKAKAASGDIASDVDTISAASSETSFSSSDGSILSDAEEVAATKGKDGDTTTLDGSAGAAAAAPTSKRQKKSDKKTKSTKKPPKKKSRRLTLESKLRQAVWRN